jgi:hypothetical protein
MIGQQMKRLYRGVNINSFVPSRKLPKRPQKPPYVNVKTINQAFQPKGYQPRYTGGINVKKTGLFQQPTSFEKFYNKVRPKFGPPTQSKALIPYMSPETFVNKLIGNRKAFLPKETIDFRKLPQKYMRENVVPVKATKYNFSLIRDSTSTLSRFGVYPNY